MDAETLAEAVQALANATIAVRCGQFSTAQRWLAKIGECLDKLATEPAPC